jgi:HEAT repeat protein
VSDEVDTALAMLLRPSGDAGAARERAEALEELLAHADEAHPRLVALAGAESPPALVLAALPRFGRGESVPVLEQALRRGPAPTTVVAATALAEHPAVGAREALERALEDSQAQVVASAADALGERGDANACAALRAVLDHDDPDVVERVLVAMAELGCEGVSAAGRP